MLWYFGSCLLLHLLISRIKEGCSVPVSETENVYDQGTIKLHFLNTMRADKHAHSHTSLHRICFEIVKLIPKMGKKSYITLSPCIINTKSLPFCIKQIE